MVNLAALAVGSQDLRNVRGGEFAIIFQKTMTAFSPVHTIGWQIREAILHHEDMSTKEAEERVVSHLGQVGFPDPEKRLNTYPFELSGGMLHRAMTAMDLACAPRVLIVDEPTTALDVTIQAQILDLLRLLQRDTSTSIIFITHDMGMIAEMADDVSFTIRAGETIGLVGESGCVKSTVGKSVIRAVEPTDGDVIFHLDQPQNLAKLSRERLKVARRHIQLVFQDPFSSLSPRHRVRDIIGEPLKVNDVAAGKDLEDQVGQLMSSVGLRPEYQVQYPHAFSGGQRQRIGIAKALAMHPKLII